MTAVDDGGHLHVVRLVPVDDPEILKVQLPYIVPIGVRDQAILKVLCAIGTRRNGPLILFPTFLNFPLFCLNTPRRILRQNVGLYYN